MRYLITVSYDGTEFSGYQKQPKMRTVQGEIEKALKEISGGKKIDIHASGRTDAGVHAMAQKIHFDLDMNITLEKLAKGLNSLLPKDIFVRKVEEVSSDFHARFSAISAATTISIILPCTRPMASISGGTSDFRDPFRRIRMSTVPGDGDFMILISTSAPPVYISSCLQLSAIPSGVTNIGLCGLWVYTPVFFSIISSIPVKQQVPPTSEISST